MIFLYLFVTDAAMLTATPFQHILSPLSAHLKGGRGNPITLGQKRPLSNAVFLCQSKFKAVSIRFNSVMAALRGQLSGWPLLMAVFPHPYNAVANVVENKSGGLHPQSLGSTAMNTQTTGKIRPQSPQEQSRIESLLINALQELTHIETLSCVNADNDSVLTSVFQHSQRGLNALHDLKNALSMNEEASHD